MLEPLEDNFTSQNSNLRKANLYKHCRRSVYIGPESAHALSVLPLSWEENEAKEQGRSAKQGGPSHDEMPSSLHAWCVHSRAGEMHASLVRASVRSCTMGMHTS